MKLAFFGPGDFKGHSRTSTSRVRTLWRACVRNVSTYTVLDGGASTFQFLGLSLSPGLADTLKASMALDEFEADFAIVADEAMTERWVELASKAKRRIFAPTGSVREALANAEALKGVDEIWVRTPSDALLDIVKSQTAKIVVVRDAFETPELERMSSARTVAILNEVPTADAIAGLADLIARTSRERITYLVAPDIYYALSQRDADLRYAIRVGGIDEALAKAQIAVARYGGMAREPVVAARRLGIPVTILADSEGAGKPFDDAEEAAEGAEICRGVEACIQSLLRKLDDAPGTDGEASGRQADDGFHRLEIELASALQLQPGQDRGSFAQMLAANLALDVRIDSSYYNAWSRVLEVNLFVHGCELFDKDVGGTFSNKTDVPLHNAWVQWVQRTEVAGQSVLLLKAVAVVPQSVEPQDLSIVLSIFGAPFLILETPSDVPRQTSGLIGMEVDPSSAVEVDFWSTEADCPIQFGRRMRSVETKLSPEGRPHVLTARGSWPFDRETLTVLPKNGIGQRFRQFSSVAPNRIPSSGKLEGLRNAFAGKTAWLVGNGPSVLLQDLERLQGALTFCFNRFYLAYPDLAFRPTFTVTGDEQMIEDFGQEIVDNAGGTVFVANFRPPDLTGDYCWVRQVSGFPSLFSKDASRRVAPGGSSLYAAMQIGYFLGIRNFYIYGADFKFTFNPVVGSSAAFRSASGDGNHFIQNYRSGRPWCPPAIQNILSSFLAARALMESEGGFIRNATRGGELEVFERQDFDTAISLTDMGFDGPAVSPNVVSAGREIESAVSL